MNTITFPTTAGEVVHALIQEGYDANAALRAVTTYNKSAFIGIKMTATAYKHVLNILNQNT